MKTSIHVTALTGLLALAVSGCAASPSIDEGGSEPIRFGAPVSLSGPYAQSGEGLKCAYELWETWVNDRGGLQVGDEKRLVEVSFSDDRSDPNTAVQLTE